MNHLDDCYESLLRFINEFIWITVSIKIWRWIIQLGESIYYDGCNLSSWIPIRLNLFNNHHCWLTLHLLWKQTNSSQQRPPQWSKQRSPRVLLKKITLGWNLKKGWWNMVEIESLLFEDVFVISHSKHGTKREYSSLHHVQRWQFARRQQTQRCRVCTTHGHGLMNWASVSNGCIQFTTFFGQRKFCHISFVDRPDSINKLVW